MRGKNAFKNVIVNGIVQAEDGKKMSKRLNNYPDPMTLLDKYGADAMRSYLASSSIVAAENLNFSEKGVEEAVRKINMILLNVYKFYEMYANEGQAGTSGVVSNNVLDLWILAKLNELIVEVTKSMNAYDLPRSTRPVADFINDLSTWYIRRSRDRFKSDDLADKNNALATTKFVLMELSKVMAPFMPFIAEDLWQKVSGYNFTDNDKSVHLESWPTSSNILDGKSAVLNDMETVRKIVEAGLAQRDAKGIKIRQPLPYYATDIVAGLGAEFIEIIKDELNILEVRFGINELGTEMTDDLRLEGYKREMVRIVNNLRKNANLTIADRVVIYWQSDGKFVQRVARELANELKKDTLSIDIKNEKTEVEIEKEVKVNEEMAWLGVKKVN